MDLGFVGGLQLRRVVALLLYVTQLLCLHVLVELTYLSLHRLCDSPVFILQTPEVVILLGYSIL